MIIDRAEADRGSTLPLILGFVVIALLMVAGSVIASQAFVQQRDLQATCDGAAVAAAASAADLAGERSTAGGNSLTFTTVRAAVTDYLARDADREPVQIRSVLAPDARTITLTCVQTRPIAFGAVFGHADGLRHTATSSARAPVTTAP